MVYYHTKNCAVRHPPTQVGSNLFVSQGVIHKTQNSFFVLIGLKKELNSGACREQFFNFRATKQVDPPKQVSNISRLEYFFAQPRTK
jgi:hypothetical protein